jgi:stage V sporulation protein AD
MSIKLKNPPSISYWASVGGKEEHEGPMGSFLDAYDETNRFSAETWEKSESEMQRIALQLAMSKNGLRCCDFDLLLAGDLINQCTSSTFGLLEFDIPFAGLFGACSTAAESIALAALLIEGGRKRIGAVTSSHFCAAERQFRFPLEYGGQRAPTCQRTVTASAAFILEAKGKGPKIKEVEMGISVDGGITDANNMGAAMAPAAMDTLMRFFQSTGYRPSDFDGIYSGDLGMEGYKIVLDLMKERGYDLSKVYHDCGMMIYNRSFQDMHAGGSGCGCSALVLAAKLLPELVANKMQNILFIGTGALMSPASVQQGDSIPGIAHLIFISTEAEK